MKELLKGLVKDWGLPSGVADVLRSVPALRKRVRYIPTRGLPPGLSRTHFSRVVNDVLGETLQRTLYRHMSQWKEKGAYRILLHTKSGATESMIYKDVDYGQDDVAGLHELGIQPGPPEYQIYTHCSDQMQEYVPQVHYCARFREGTRYHILLEDADLSHAEAEDLRGVVRELARLHKRLEAAVDASDADKGQLIDYGVEFKKGLPEYAIEGITDFAAITESNTARLICEGWNAIERVYRRHAGKHQDLLVPVHGDTNLTNVLMSARNGEVRFVDWELAGIGLPQWDLAGLLKSAPVDDETENALVELFYEKSDRRGLSRSDNRFLYRLCKLEHAMLGASLWTRYFTRRPTLSGAKLQPMIESELNRLVTAYRHVGVILVVTCSALLF